VRDHFPVLAMRGFVTDGHQTGFDTRLAKRDICWSLGQGSWSVIVARQIIAVFTHIVPLFTMSPRGLAYLVQPYTDAIDQRHGISVQHEHALRSHPDHVSILVLQTSEPGNLVTVEISNAVGMVKIPEVGILCKERAWYVRQVGTMGLQKVVDEYQHRQCQDS
jgi:hypothetical protein